MSVTGPFTESFSSTDYIVDRVWYRQKPITSKALPYLCRRSRIQNQSMVRPWFTAGNNATQSYCSSFVSGSNDQRNRLQNRTYAKLLEKVRGEHGGVQGLTALAEYRSSLDMIVKRGSQFLRAGRAANRLDVGAFLKEFDIDPRDRRLSDRVRSQKQAKSAASLWLETWFGWSPSLADVYNGINLLTQEPPAQTFKAISVESWKQNYADGNLFESVTGTCGVRMQAAIRVSNPNAWLANQLGLINPAQTALELIPFSWLVGWWVNASQILGAMTDFVGLEVENPRSTVFCQGTGKHRILDPFYGQECTSSVVQCQRVTSLLGPVLRYQSLKGLSVTRGLTAASLVVQMFLKVDSKR